MRTARGRYALPASGDAFRAAQELSGVVALRSAAMARGWEVAVVPEVPEVAVPRNRKVGAERRSGVQVLWMDLTPDDRQAELTSALRTVVDCARRLPFPEALAIADSALRSGDVMLEELRAVRVRGAGAAAVRQVLDRADGRAQNPFESVLRALAIEEGWDVEPQLAVDLGTGTIHPDVVAVADRTALEADSWTWHTSRKAHKRDCARYNLMVIHGWRVLRFTWEQVMHEPAYVRWALRAARRVGREEACSCSCRHTQPDRVA